MLGLEPSSSRIGAEVLRACLPKSRAHLRCTSPTSSSIPWRSELARALFAHCFVLLARFPSGLNYKGGKTTGTQQGREGGPGNLRVAWKEKTLKWGLPLSPTRVFAYHAPNRCGTAPLHSPQYFCGLTLVFIHSMVLQVLPIRESLGYELTANKK